MYYEIISIYQPVHARIQIFFSGGGGGGFLTENWLVSLYDTLISGFQWMLAVYKKSQRSYHETVSTFRTFTFNSF